MKCEKYFSPSISTGFVKYSEWLEQKMKGCANYLKQEGKKFLIVLLAYTVQTKMLIVSFSVKHHLK